jgi:protein ImuB
VLGEWCRQFCPVVGVEPPDTLLLDLSDLEHLHPDETVLARNILRGLAERRLSARLAIADTLGAAWALTREEELQNENCNLQLANCKTQSDGITPSHFALCKLHFAFCNSSWVIVPPGQTLPVLASLPIRSLRLPDETVALLAQLGLHRIGQLERLPREELPSRFGPAVLRRLDQALGRSEERLPVLHAAPEFSARESFEYPTTDHAVLEAALRRLIERLALQLTEHGRGALHLEATLWCPPAESVRLEVGLFQATAAAEHLWGLVQVQLERSRIAEPIVGVEIAVTAHDLLQRRQQELFTDVPPRRHPRHLAALVDRLANRLGSAAVGRPRLLPDAQPELAYRYAPLVSKNSVRNRFSGGRTQETVPGTVFDEVPARKTVPGNVSDEALARKTVPGNVFEEAPARKTVPGTFLAMRPLRLLRRPVAVEVMAVLPDGPPVALRLREHSYQIVDCKGPERIETGWWRHRPVGRDYYRIETAAGQRFWLFRRLSDGRWFLHGAFD